MEKEIDLDEYNSGNRHDSRTTGAERPSSGVFGWSVLDMKRNGFHDGSAYQICKTIYGENFNLALIDKIEAVTPRML